MKKNLFLSLVVSALCFGAVQAAAQTATQTTATQMTASTTLPKVMWLYHETVKPAKGTEHAKVEQGFARLWAKAQVQPFLGLESLSSTNETLFVSGYDSFASFETDYQVFMKTSSGSMQTEFNALERQEADVISNIRSAVAVLRDDISYKADGFMQGLPQARYLEIMTMRLAPGKEEQFAEVAKFYRDAFQKGDWDAPFAIYRIMFGAPEGTYLVVVPMKSLKTMDEAMVTHPRLLQAMGEDNMKRIMKTAAEIVTYSETNLYAFNPKISNVSAEFAAADPQFWGLKPVMAKPAAGARASSKK